VNHLAKFINLLKSLKLSLALLIIIIPIIAAGNLIPQKGRVSPAEIFEWQGRYPSLSRLVSFTGFDHVYTTWWFLLIFTVLFFNMGIITWGLIGRTRRKAKGLHRFSGEASAYYSLGNFSYKKEAVNSFEKILNQRRYNIIKVGGEVYARKGWFGIWGGTILHVGLIIILFGAVISGLTRFNGYTEIGVGQGFDEKKESYLQSSYGVLFPDHKDGIHVFLEKVEEKDIGGMEAILSTITITDSGRHALTKTIRMNEPLSYKGMKLYQSRYNGPALLFSVYGPDGRFNAGYVNLQTLKGGKARAYFTFPGAPLQAMAEYTPGSEFIDLEVRKKKALVYHGPMRVEATLDLDDWRLTLLSISRWSGIIVVYDWAVPIIFFGFWLSIAGVAIMGFFDPREIWAKTVERDGEKFIEMLGWGRWKNMFLDEYNEMMSGVLEWRT
jgi:cytochrome c biogenesis protein